MRRELNNVISVAHSIFRFALLKMVHMKSLSVHGIERFSPNVVFEMNKGAIVNIGEKVRVHSGSKIKVRKGGRVVIESGVKINYNCIIVCHKSIQIGEGTEFGPSVYIYDHDHDFRAGLKANKFKEAPVKIGKNCWIGANTVILRGATIGDGCVIAAGSVVTGNVPNHTIYIQKRQTQVTKIL